MNWKVIESRLLVRQLERSPQEIQQRYAVWRRRVQNEGPYLGGGYRVHGLSGKRKGEMAVRLNRQWRVIFRILKEELIVEAMEVTPHKY